MSSRWKKVWTDFWGNKSRSFLAVLTIMVGTFAVGFTSNMYLYILESMESDYLSASPSEGTVYAYPLDDDLVRIASTVPGVDAVEGRSMIEANLIPAEGEPILIDFTAIEDPNARQVDRLQPAEGETNIPPLGEKEVLIDASAKSLGLKPGDILRIELEDGKIRKLKLAGYIHDVTGAPYNMAQFINAYVKPDTLIWLGGSSNYSALAISVKEKQTDADHVTEVAQAVADRMERGGANINFVNVYQPGHHYAWSIMQGVFFLLGSLGYMTVLLSAFLIVNTVTALMTQQTRQIGIMKAVGGGTGQISFMYLVLILSFGLIALAIAIPLANGAAQNLATGLTSYINVAPLSFKSYPQTILQQALVALLVPLLAALWPIFNSVRVTVREATSDYGIGGDSKPREKSIKKGSNWFPRPIQISLRNAFRRKLRLGLTLFTLVLGGAIFIGVYNLWSSFDKAINDIQGYILADVNIGFSRSYRFSAVAPIAESVSGVTGVEGWMQYSGTLITDREEAGTQILFVAPPSTSTLIDPVITSGRWLKTGDENAVVIGNHLLEIFPDLKVGDWLTIDVDGYETKWQIIGTYSLVGNVNPPLLYVNYEYLSWLVGRPDEVYSVRVLTDQHGKATQKRISDEILAKFDERGIQYTSSELGADFVANQKATTDIMVYLMLVMASMIAVVGGLGLMGTMSINVLERTREIGVMRAIGASNGNIQSIVIVEGLTIGLISWMISILFSIPITNVLCFGVGMALMKSALVPVYGVTGIIAWLIFNLFLAALASAIPARRASRLTVRDTLAYE